MTDKNDTFCILNDNPLRVFDLSSLNMSLCDDASAKSDASANATVSGSAAKIDSLTDPTIGEEPYAGVETTMVPVVNNAITRLQPIADHRKKLLEYRYGITKDGAFELEPGLIIQLRIYDDNDFVFNSFVFLGPTALEGGMPSACVPWRYLPNKLPDADPIVLQACNMHYIALQAQELRMAADGVIGCPAPIKITILTGDGQPYASPAKIPRSIDSMEAIIADESPAQWYFYPRGGYGGRIGLGTHVIQGRESEEVWYPDDYIGHRGYGDISLMAAILNKRPNLKVTVGSGYIDQGKSKKRKAAAFGDDNNNHSSSSGGVVTGTGAFGCVAFLMPSTSDLEAMEEDNNNDNDNNN